MSTDVLYDLRADLVRGIERQGARSVARRRLAVVGSCAAAATAVVIAALALPGPTTALAITESDQWIELRIQDATASPDEMNRQLREASIDAEVIVVPVSPTRAGEWVGARAAWPGVPDGVDQHALGDQRIRELNSSARLGQIRLAADTARIPRQFKGHLLLYAGRAAAPGEEDFESHAK